MEVSYGIILYQPDAPPFPCFPILPHTKNMWGETRRSDPRSGAAKHVVKPSQSRSSRLTRTEEKSEWRNVVFVNLFRI